MSPEPTEIVTTQIKHIDTVFEPGDGIDLDQYLRNGSLNERLVDSFRRTGQVVPLTREAYQNQIARRPKGTIGRGFTRPYLEQKGIIDPLPPKVKAAKPEGQPQADAKTTPAPVTEIEVPANAVKVGENFIVPFERGNFKFFNVVDKDGRLLRPSAFRKQEKAVEYLESLQT